MNRNCALMLLIPLVAAAGDGGASGLRDGGPAVVETAPHKKTPPPEGETEKPPPRTAQFLRERTIRLDIGQPLDAVLEALGKPDEYEAAICGEKTKKRWKCYILTYRPWNEPRRPLVIYLQDDAGLLTVNDWTWL